MLSQRPTYQKYKDLSGLIEMSNSKRDNTIRRIVMSVDKFYKHDEADETFAYGFDMSTKEKIRIRMSSSEEFSKIINKLNKNNSVESVTTEDVHKKFDSGRNQRTSLETHDRFTNQGRIICFDKCEEEYNEKLGEYKSYVAQWCNVMSNNPNSQLIKALTTINVHKKSNGDFFVKAQIIEDASHLQVPNVKANSPALYNEIIKQNLLMLVKALSNETNEQPERTPFSKIVVRYENGKVLTSIPLIPTFDTADRESVKQLSKPAPMQADSSNKSYKNYRVAKSPLESITDILNGQDYHTANFNPSFNPTTQYEKEQFDRQLQNVYVMDQARIALFALLGDRKVKIFFNENIDQEKNRNLKKLYAGLISQKLLPEVYFGQQLQLGALYKDTFLKKFFNNKTPHAGFRKVDPDIDLRSGVGVRGLDAPPLINQFTDPNGTPKPHDLNPQFLSMVDPLVMNKLTHAKQKIAEAFIVIQPHQRSSKNCFVSFIEPVELTQTRMNALEFSELTVEHVQLHKASIDSPLSSNFNHNSLPDPQKLMEQIRQKDLGTSIEIENTQVKEKSSLTDDYSPI